MIQYLKNKLIFFNKYFKTTDGLEINVCANNKSYWYIINDDTNNRITKFTEFTDIFTNYNACLGIVKEKYGELTLITDKEKLLEYMKSEQAPDNRKNRMGCSESWYDTFYAIKQTFEIYDVVSMQDTEINNLLTLAANIQDALY